MTSTQVNSSFYFIFPWKRKLSFHFLRHEGFFFLYTTNHNMYYVQPTIIIYNICTIYNHMFMYNQCSLYNHIQCTTLYSTYNHIQCTTVCSMYNQFLCIRPLLINKIFQVFVLILLAVWFFTFYFSYLLTVFKITKNLKFCFFPSMLNLKSLFVYQFMWMFIYAR